MNDVVKKPFFRADQVGSLLRPQGLLDARTDFEAGKLRREALKEVEDDAIRQIAKVQEGIGLRAVTDGEFRRKNWWVDFIGRLQGVELHEGDEKAVFISEPNNDWQYVPMDVKTVARLKVDANVLKSEFAFLSSCTDGVAKITLPSPTRMHFHGGRGNVSEEVYPDIEDFFADIVGIYREQIAALESAGCRYIQVDDPLLTYFCSDRLRERLRVQGDDPDKALDRYVKLVNDCIAERQPDTQLSIHLCRGNSRSAWISEGGYEKIAEQVFPHLQPDAFFLEYDDPRSGSFEPLTHIPKERKVVLGLVTTKRGDLECKDELKRRVEEASQYVPIENLAISPQCGFASVVEGNIITFDDEVAKLSLVVETAEEIWGGLTA